MNEGKLFIHAHLINIFSGQGWQPKLSSMASAKRTSCGLSGAWRGWEKDASLNQFLLMLILLQNKL